MDKETDKQSIGENVLMVLIAIIFFGGLFLGCRWLWLHSPKPPVCVAYKSVVSVEPIPQENFWGKEIHFLVKFDDGSYEENNWGDSRAIGEQTCKTYE